MPTVTIQIGQRSSFRNKKEGVHEFQLTEDELRGIQQRQGSHHLKHDGSTLVRGLKILKVTQ